MGGLIKKEDLIRKYNKELFANEIVLLAYYIAAINIETAYHDLLESKEYIPFEGIIFLHCDWHADAYIRVEILDKIFLMDNFRGEIVA